MKCVEYNTVLSKPLTHPSSLPTHLAATRSPTPPPPPADAVISASWDSTLHISPTNTNSAALTLPVHSKVYSLALSPTKIVAAMGGRAVWIYDVRNLSEALEKNDPGAEVGTWQKRESSLKFMTRAVRCMPNDQGQLSERGGGGGAE